MQASEASLPQPDELTRKLVTTAYAQFCAQHAARPSGLLAKRFAVEVTESDAREYHGMTSASLERFLIEAFPDDSSRSR